MGSFFQNLWTRLIGGLGQIGPIIQVIVSELHVAIKERDQNKILAACDKLDAVAADITRTTTNLRENLADGILTAPESAESLLDIEQLVTDAARLAKK